MAEPVIRNCDRCGNMECYCVCDREPRYDADAIWTALCNGTASSPKTGTLLIGYGHVLEAVKQLNNE